MSFPVTAILLASRGEIDIGSDRRHLRLFMVDAEENQGVGIQWTRPRLFERNCLKTDLNYIMWSGEGEGSEYCQCVDPQTNQIGSANSC